MRDGSGFQEDLIAREIRKIRYDLHRNLFPETMNIGSKTIS